jgi:hypothetical protein
MHKNCESRRFTVGERNCLQRRITPQFSGRATPCDARRERIMQWRARAVAATTCHGPLQLLVRRWHGANKDVLEPHHVHLEA